MLRRNVKKNNRRLRRQEKSLTNRNKASPFRLSLIRLNAKTFSSINCI